MLHLTGISIADSFSFRYYPEDEKKYKLFPLIFNLYIFSSPVWIYPARN